ncbi:MAG TPA: Loki-CTERM sorting domain-containing protein [Cytophagaceae bacterium]|jgi:magnesium transporter|nr:Loki-CTERM sorting domain-containing protein [Cytophagaceae bacterium]
MIKTILSIAESGPFDWIDVYEPTVEELISLAKKYDLHRYTVRDCLEAGHLPKFEKDEKYNFIITRAFSPKTDINPHTIQDLTTKVAVFYSSQFLITIHRQKQPFLKTIKDKYCYAGCNLSTQEMVTQILWHALHSYEAPGQELSDIIDEYERQIFLGDTVPSIQQKLYYIKHKGSVCKKVLILTTDLINQVYHHGTPNPYLQDLKDLHLKLITIYDEIQEDINNLLGISISMAAQKTNEVVKILTILSVFFMPLTFIVGVYGMNFKYMPELNQRWGYPVAWFIMVCVAGSIYLWFKRKRWL